MRKIKLFLSALTLMFAGSAFAALPVPTPAAPQLGAPSYILVDFHSGQELAGKNADERMEPASLTKLMTVYAVLHELNAGRLSLDDQVTVSEKAWRAEGSRMFIEVGTKVSVEKLLRGVIIQSGNDASIALAEHIAGSEGTFAQLMNQYAQTLGMTGTHFMNATGLPHPEHFSTARDLAKLAAAIIREFPEHYSLYSEKQFTYNGITQYNRNKLLWRDPSVDGLKTGHTQSAGYGLITSAQRENMRLISVVMGTKGEDDRAQQSQALLNYGFRFFETHRLYAAGTALAEPRVWKGVTEYLPLGLSRDLYVTIPRNQYEQLDASMSVDGMITAPLQPGVELGRVIVRLGDTVVSEAPLVSLSAMEEGGLWRKLVDEVLLMFQ